MGALAELRQQGLIGHIGLSNVSATQFAAACDIVEIGIVTAHYNLMTRKRAPLLHAVEAHGAVFSPWRPVSFTDNPANRERARETIAPIAAAHAATPEQVALAWLLHQSPAILPIPGTTSLEHLIENIQAAQVNLTADELVAIDRIIAE